MEKKQTNKKSPKKIVYTSYKIEEKRKPCMSS